MLCCHGITTPTVGECYDDTEDTVFFVALLGCCGCGLICIPACLCLCKTKKLCCWASAEPAEPVGNIVVV